MLARSFGCFAQSSRRFRRFPSLFTMAEAKEQEAAAAAAVAANTDPCAPPPPPPATGEQPPPYQPSYGTTEPVPPSYEQAQQPQEPPPSYEDVFGQVRAAKTESSTIAEFLKKFLIILLGTIGCSICIGLILAIPIAMIVIGAEYLYDCPRERYIPIYLIVGGCFGVIKNLSNVVQRVRNRQDNRDDENSKTNPFDGTLNCFLVAWFIAGNVWIYRIHQDFDDIDSSSSRYCNPTLYWFAFWITTSTYIIMALVCCCLCCAGALASLADQGNANQNSNAAGVVAP